MGNLGVGKTCLLYRYVDNAYDQVKPYISTVIVDFKSRDLVIGEDRVQLQFWDTGGHEKYRHITRGYYRKVHGVVFVFDLTDRETFKEVAYWMEDFGQFAEGGE